MKISKWILASSLVIVPLITSCKDEPAKESNAETDMPAETSVQSTTEAASDGDIALNPKHGEPNHRCDIPVGAPLNSPPAQNTTQQSPLMNNGSTPATGKVNPPHGQPGHRCDIKVGDPL